MAPKSRAEVEVPLPLGWKVKGNGLCRDQQAVKEFMPEIFCVFSQKERWEYLLQERQEGKGDLKRLIVYTF